MKIILLLAAVHLLIINQSNKDAKIKVQAGSSKNTAPRQEQKPSPPYAAEPGNKNYVTAVFTGDLSNRDNRRPALKQ